MIDINRYNTDMTFLKKVLKIIYEKRRISRNELAMVTKLSTTSITKFVNILMTDGVVMECGTMESTGGRKTALLCINPEYAYILGVDIGGFAAKIGVVRMDGTIVEDWFIRAQNDKVPVKCLDPQSLCDRIRSIFTKYNKIRFMAICVGISGMVDYGLGRVIFCPNLYGWDNVVLGDILRDAFGLPTFVDVSARCMALAEQYYGAGRGVSNQVFVSLGKYSISSALIFDSKLYRGSSGFAGEIGHVMSSDLGERCSCGNFDCLELTATFQEITYHIYPEIENIKVYSPLKQLLPEDYNLSDLTPSVILQAIEAGDKLCYETVMTAGRRTGTALANLLNVLNPKLVVLGGGVIELFPIIMDTIRNRIKERVLVTVQQNLEVQQAEMGWQGSVIGSTVLALMEFFK